MVVMSVGRRSWSVKPLARRSPPGLSQPAWRESYSDTAVVVEGDVGYGELAARVLASGLSWCTSFVTCVPVSMSMPSGVRVRDESK